ncbi:MAG: CotD family spore coat protein [Bacilli bacterium]
MLFDRECGQMPRQNMPMMQPQNMPMGPMMQPQGPFGAGTVAPEVIEPTMTQCVQREIFHEVPHVCPKHTHIINKHIYKHTYRPQFSCSEENQVCNIQCGSCCQF